MAHTYYEALGVSEKATAAEIKAAYRRLIKELHPDRAGDSPQAAERARLVIEAYETLKDSVKRSSYDSLLELQRDRRSERRQSQRAAPDKPEPEPEPLKCESCGRQDSSLRVSVFVWVLSLFVITYKNGSCKILCSRCRLWHSLLYNLEVLFFGWWGFPWGPVYSIGALLDNARGGIHPPENNAALLALLSYQLYQKNHVGESIRALEESERLQPRAEKREFLLHLRGLERTASDRTNTPRTALLNPAWSNAVLCVAFVGGVILLFSQVDFSSSRGYQSNFQKPSPTGNPVVVNRPRDITSATKTPNVGEQRSPRSKTAWDASNAAISGMASYIARKVPFVGTTPSASGTIRNYELDRSVLSVDSLRVFSNLTTMAYATASQALVDKETMRFAAACYYNANLMEISVKVIHDYQESGTLDNGSVRRLQEIQKDSIVTDWLTASGLKTDYDAMYRIIRKMSRLLDSLDRFESLAERLGKKSNSDLEELELMEKRIEELVGAGNHEEHDRVVDLYNSRVEAYNKLLESMQSLPVAADRVVSEIEGIDLDLAFNAALDKEILASEFDDVSIGDSLVERTEKSDSPLLPPIRNK